MRDVLVLGQASFHPKELNRMHVLKDSPHSHFFEVFITCLQMIRYLGTGCKTSYKVFGKNPDTNRSSSHRCGNIAASLQRARSKSAFS